MTISRDQFDLPRWARTDAGVDNTANVSEPAGSKKDTGWISAVDEPNPNWFNWLGRETFKTLSYLINYMGSWLASDDQIVRAGKAAGHFALTRTGTWEVTIAEGAVIIDGDYYEIPETVVANPAQTALSGTMHRIIVAELSSGAPTLTLVDGVADDTDPALSDGQIPLHRILQDNGPAGADAPTEDMREYGMLSSGNLVIDDDALLGEHSSGHYRIETDYENALVRIGIDPNDNTRGSIQVTDGGVVDIGDGLLEIDIPNDQVEVDAQRFVFSGAGETTIENFPPSKWLTADGTTTDTVYYWALSAGDVIRAPMNPPLGSAVTTRMRAWVSPGSGATMKLQLYKYTKGSYSAPSLVDEVSSSGTGNQMLTLTPSIDIAENTEMFELRITSTSAGGNAHYADAQYTITSNPFGVES